MLNGFRLFLSIAINAPIAMNHHSVGTPLYSAGWGGGPILRYTWPARGGGCLGGQDPHFWGTPKLHKRGEKNVARVCANTLRFST